MNKNLVVYFSATGVTKEAAIKLAKEVKGDLLEIVPRELYTDDDLDWTNKNSRSSIEIKKSTCRPEIEDITINLDNYHTVYLGYPIWWDLAPNVVKTFLDRVDLTNKEIITFCTSGGTSLDNSTKDLQDTYPNLRIFLGKRM